MKLLANPVYYIIFFAISASLAALGLLSGFVSAPAVFEIRGPATGKFTELRQEDIPLQIEEREKNGRKHAIRRRVNDENIFVQVLLAKDLVEDAFWLAEEKTAPRNAADALQNDYKIFHTAPGCAKTLMPLLPLEGSPTPQLFGLLPYENTERFDVNGQPLRWQLADSLLWGYRASQFGKKTQTDEKETPHRAHLAENFSLSTSPARYRHLVERFARRYNLSIELVYAIIHSESDFSPTLVSNKSAMGLMQILPGTASGEIHSFLYGKRGRVSFEELRIPEINIHYGTAYLHILLNRYFQNVKNPVSREYCAIASYNMGPNRFLRLYGGNNNSAIEKINQFTAEELYDDLVRRLPARETRFYLGKVKRMKSYYTALLGAEEEERQP